MSEFTIQSRASIPKHVATLLKIGLETQDEDDRLLALQAANHFDRRNGSSSGAVVVETYARQMGLDFAAAVGILDTSAAWYTKSATEHESLLINEVARAVGASLGVATVIFELVDTETEMGVLTAPTRDDAVDLIDLGTVLDRLPDMNFQDFRDTTEEQAFQALGDLSQERPYGVIQRFWQSQGMENFENALAGIYGGADREVEQVVLNSHPHL